MLLLSRLQDLERAQQTLVHAHHRACVVKLATVVGCRKEGDQLAFAKELVAILNDLVSTADEVHVMFLQEARYDVWTKGEGNTAVVFTPAGDILIRVRPEQIAKETAVGNLENLSVRFAWIRKT